MKIVIDIPESIYETIEEDQFISRYQLAVLQSQIRKGVPLPKGHGRLIDADAFIAKMEDVSKRQKYKELLIDKNLTVDDVFKAIIESLQNKGLANGDTPTILEADKAESEDEDE